jgi:diguanylate cyclase (GGDEF)-like protein/PAS domain S-box-containing protein
MKSFLKLIDAHLDRLVGLRDVSPSTLGLVRAEQIASVLKLTPSMMAGNVVGVAIFLTTFWRSNVFLPVAIWSLLVLGLALLSIRSWMEMRGAAPRKRASHRAIERASINAIILGVIWGALPILGLSSGSASSHLLVYVMMTGMICGGGFALSAMPQAVISFLIPVMIGSTIGLVQSADYMQMFVSVLFVTFSGIIVMASLAHARTFVGRIVAQIESDERGAVIGMLLKNFEENSSDWLWSSDAEGNVQLVSERFAEAAGCAVGDLQGMPFLKLFATPASTNHVGFGVILEAMRVRHAFRDTELPVMVDGKECWWRLTGQAFYDDVGHFIGYRGVCSDITSQKVIEERVAYLAHNDALTGVANRSRFNDALNQNLTRMSRYGLGFILLYIDLDQFKAVNDTKGHDVGDRLLIEVARRFSAVLRENDVLARLGGDEFAVILTNTTDMSAAATLAQRLIDCVGQPIEIGRDILAIGASIGIAMAPSDGVEADQIVRNADLALYRAKSDGRRTFRFFEEEMDKRSQERRSLEFDLGMALQKKELELCYQPLMNVASGKPTGFEALIRWNHPLRGQISPSAFIPIAEQTGLIKAIGEWVINEACRAATLWPDDVMVAVNLSPRQFDTDKIVSVVKDALALSGLRPDRLELEITESLLIDNQDSVSTILHSLKELGVSIAMDDFGTGYSSLAYLWKFPFDKIKIDRSFVAAIENDQAARDILRTIATLGETLKMRITAEGVETEEQASFLHTIAHQLQGFYFAKPIAEENLAAFLLNDFAAQLMSKSKPQKVALKIAS